MASPPVPNRRPGLTVHWPRRWPAWLLALLALLAAAAIGWLAHGSHTTTHTTVRTVTQPAATIYQDTPAGAALAPASVISTFHQASWDGELGYRVLSYTPQRAKFETIEKALPHDGLHRTVWIAWDIQVAYQGGKWVVLGVPGFIEPDLNEPGEDPTQPGYLYSQPDLQGYMPWPTS